jgi:hypothetical protein
MQKISKASLVECYLLQDDWTSNKNHLHGLDSNIILDSWESNGEPTIMEVIDPHLLAACTSSHGIELPVSIQFSTLQMLCDQTIRYPPTSTVSIHERRMFWYLRV